MDSDPEQSGFVDSFARNRWACALAEPAEKCGSLDKAVGLWNALQREDRMPSEVEPDFQESRRVLAGCPGRR